MEREVPEATTVSPTANARGMLVWFIFFQSFLKSFSVNTIYNPANGKKWKYVYYIKDYNQRL